MADGINEELLREQPHQTIDDLLSIVASYQPPENVEIIRKAYEFSEKAHTGQVRRSGEPYIFHPLGVAIILAELRLDLATVACGLLHDTVEDTQATLEDIKKNFGETIMQLVDGVTKISLMKFRNTHEKQGENIRKMIVAMGKDVRVVLVKLADRLHNMRTLHHMPPEKQSRIAEETLDIYAPLASRLGINSLKIELEDLSFRYSHPEAYYSLAQKLARKKKEREKYIEDVIRILTQELGKRTKINFVVSGRPKHLWSIYRKMQASNIEYEQVYDVLAFRICADSVSECYEILGHVHSLFKPIPGRFKDFIAMPKNNNYQSLHTTVIGPQAERIEIQIRTHEMHLIADKGIAAHWQYKEGANSNNNDKDNLNKFNWLRELVQLHQQTKSADEFLESVKTDLFESEIYVFTPKGEVKEFPEGATPVDFAYSVHTDVGNSIVAARVNGKIVPLKYQLQNGDTIEVITSKTQTPSKDWLKLCVTTRAKSKIRMFVRAEQRRRAQVLGTELLDKAFRKVGASFQRQSEKEDFKEFLKRYGLGTVEDLYIRVGYGTITPQKVLEELLPNHKVSAPEESYLKRAFKSAAQKKSSSPIRVDGMDDVLVRFAKCCSPIPGDAIMGFITLGRGLVIHRADCEKAFELDQARRVDVEWNSESAKTPAHGRHVRIRVLSQDNPGLLKDLSEVFSMHGVNILNAEARTTKDLKAICTFDVQVRDTKHLSEIIASLSKAKGVIGVSRLASS